MMARTPTWRYSRTSLTVKPSCCSDRPQRERQAPRRRMSIITHSHTSTAPRMSGWLPRWHFGEKDKVSLLSEFGNNASQTHYSFAGLAKFFLDSFLVSMRMPVVFQHQTILPMPQPVMCWFALAARYAGLNLAPHHTARFFSSTCWP